MGILSDFEDRVGAAIEGLFAGAFRSPVQPAELAKALSRAMDDGRMVGVDRVYVPVRYRVVLSRDDATQFGRFADTLAGELATYLVDHARERGYHLTEKPRVEFSADPGLRLGRFRVAATDTPEIDDDLGLDDAFTARAERTVTAATDLATVTVGDVAHDVALRGDQVVVGRLAECQICLQDANTSRRHAAFIRLEDGWAIEDLDSTNGTRLNGKPVTRARLRDGDVVEIGVTRLVFHEPRG
ncbi:MAG: DUF3662 and FHA domain-containing protein [Anaerosomatales bacterium]|nr:DUF3662 and FHA domain-containing protein [Anaerosomatales bacterium]